MRAMEMTDLVRAVHNPRAKMFKLVGGEIVAIPLLMFLFLPGAEKHSGQYFETEQLAEAAWMARS